MATGWTLVITILMASGGQGMSSISPFESENECHKYAAYLFDGWTPTQGVESTATNRLHPNKKIVYIQTYEGEWIANWSCIRNVIPKKDNPT